jgi:hypothetical protein
MGRPPAGVGDDGAAGEPVEVAQRLGACGTDTETRAPGYRLRLEPEKLDLSRFEALIEEASALELERAAAKLRAALALWRGPALAEFAYEPFAQPAIARLEELRLTVLERRIDADLACGPTEDVVAELEALVVEHPLRERFCGQLMVALYRCGRQADALTAYRAARTALVEGVGIEPGPALRDLERAILHQDPSLSARASAGAVPKLVRQGSVIVVAPTMEALERLLPIVTPLVALAPSRELIMVSVVESDDLAGSSLKLHERAEGLRGDGVSVRSAAMTSSNAVPMLTRLAIDQDADLLLLDGVTNLPPSGRFGVLSSSLLTSVVCDVGIVAGSGADTTGSGLAVLVPFSGTEHDWAAIEFAAWFARATGSPLRLLGRAADNDSEPDASHLLAGASLLVQQIVRVPTELALVPAGPESILADAARAALLVFGLTERWQQQGLGETRARIATQAPCPAVLLRKGLKPGGIAPAASLTRFTWSLGDPHNPDGDTHPPSMAIGAPPTRGRDL